jgi:hypothetical protein
MMNTQEVLIPLWRIHREVDFLVYLDQISKNIYKKIFLVTNRPKSRASPCINHKGLKTPLCILHPQVFS